MSRPVTLASLVRRSLERADLPLTTDRIDLSPGGEAETLVQEAAAELYEIVVQAFGDEYFFFEGTLTVTAGDRLVALPADHYKTIHLWWLGAGGFPGPTSPLRLERFPAEEDFLRWEDATWTNSKPPRYRERGASVYFDPAADRTYRLIIQYVPTITVIDDTSVPPLIVPTPFEGVHGWEEWLITWVAKRFLEKDRVDSTYLTQELSRLTARIEKFATRRNIRAKSKVQRTHEPRWRTGTSSVPRFRT